MHDALQRFWSMAMSDDDEDEDEDANAIDNEDGPYSPAYSPESPLQAQRAPDSPLQAPRGSYTPGYSSPYSVPYTAAHRLTNTTSTVLCLRRNPQVRLTVPKARLTP